MLEELGGQYIFVLFSYTRKANAGSEKKKELCPLASTRGDQYISCQLSEKRH